MRRRTAAMWGTGALVSLVAAGLVTLGPAAGPPLGGGSGGSAAAAELRPFAGCEELRRWYVDAALPHVGPWGLGQPHVFVADSGAVALDGAPQARVEAASPGLGDAVGSGATGTNVQEAGVDEPDVAKTDGRLVMHVTGRQVVLTDASSDPTQELARVRLPRNLAQPELLLVGDRLVVIGQAAGPRGPEWFSSRPILPGPGALPGTVRVLVLDIGDPTAPRTVSDERYDGDLLSAREHDGVVRLVTATRTPRLAFVNPDRDRDARAATRENRRIVRESRIEDWLPTSPDGDPLVECTAVHHPREHAGYGTLTVLAFPADDPAARAATAVTASGDQVYASAERLYVGTVQGGWWGGPVPLPAPEPLPLPDPLPRPLPDAVPDAVPDAGTDAVPDAGTSRQVAPRPRPVPSSTEVHAFALDGTETTYLASGTVPGRVRDRWSYSEHDGYLRVATTLGREPWDPTENAIVVLEERDGTLAEVGRAARMGLREQIQSVRWFGDLAVLVTFRQVDPLYTVDLSDPSAPRVLGELKIPGFSSYLHPVGDGRLLGLGQDANRRGATRGAQASLFNLRDLASPLRVDQAELGRDTEFAVAWDSRAFTFLPAEGLAVAPYRDYASGRMALALLRVSGDRLELTMSAPLGGWQLSVVRTLPLADGTLAVVAGDRVSLLDPA